MPHEPTTGELRDLIAKLAQKQHTTAEAIISKQDAVISILTEHSKVLKEHGKRLEDYSRRFDRQDEKIDTIIHATNDLATHMEEQHGAILSAVNEFATNTEQRLQRNEQDVDILKRGQEEIKLHLHNVAHRFATDELNHRVTRLERNAKL